MTGWLSQGVDWVNQFGWLGWWVAFLLGAVLAAFVMAGIGLAKISWIKARAYQKWSDKVDDVNPLEQIFDKKRINLSDLATPVENRIYKKIFTNCESRKCVLCKHPFLRELRVH